MNRRSLLQALLGVPVAAMAGKVAAQPTTPSDTSGLSHPYVPHIYTVDGPVDAPGVELEFMRYMLVGAGVTLREERWLVFQRYMTTKDTKSCTHTDVNGAPCMHPLGPTIADSLERDYPVHGGRDIMLANRCNRRFTGLVLVAIWDVQTRGWVKIPTLRAQWDDRMLVGSASQPAFVDVYTTKTQKLDEIVDWSRLT